MKLAILGGSFNPPHLGHLALARGVLALGYERILLVPAAAPPYKTLSPGADNHHRWALTRLAAKLLPGAEAWDGELQRGGISYTIDTVRIIKKLFPLEGLPGLVVGDDHCGNFLLWREAEKLPREACILLARRLEEGAPPFPFPCRPLENPLFPYSSTAVRAAIARGGDVSSMLPLPLWDYIRENGLYGAGV